MKIAFFGSSLVSAYWNGAATYYRGILSALAQRGHEITFYEPDAYDRQKHRDIADPGYANVVVYPGDSDDEALRMLDRASDADLVVKASGIGVYDDLLERAVIDLRRPDQIIAFWDVDAPATLDQMREDGKDPFRGLVPLYDYVFTYGGGDPVVQAYREFGARECIPIYNALDPSTHRPAPAEQRWSGDLGFLGNRLPDREARVEEFFLKAAALCPDHSFVLGGSGWHDKLVPSNVRVAGHVFTADHNAFNCSVKAALNISRESMARYGFSPATRVFEAAGAAACLITDAWEGIELFLEPGREVLVAEDGEQVADLVKELDERRAREIGEAARKRVLAEHTYAHRAAQFDHSLSRRVLCAS
jgi:spore maturation protein CgeB